MQNEGKIENRKTMITFLFDDSRAPCVNGICEINCEMNQSKYGLSFTAFNFGLIRQIWEVKVNLV